MKSYAECADIAAKAVKVLQSAKRESHQKMAERYAELATRTLLTYPGEHKSYKTTTLSGFVLKNKASELVGSIEDAQTSMECRLHRPKYRLVDGEWVPKKDTAEVDFYVKGRNGPIKRAFYI